MLLLQTVRVTRITTALLVVLTLASQYIFDQHHLGLVPLFLHRGCVFATLGMLAHRLLLHNVCGQCRRD